MRRFFVEPEQLNQKQSEEISQGQILELTGDEYHHLKNVSRLEEGERVELLDGSGRIALATIQKIGKKSGLLKIEKIENLPPLPKPHIEIVLCVPRFQKMDLIIQKSVELGASQISPVVSDRSFIKSLTPDLEGKVGRWRKIALEACKQSGRAWPMSISHFDTLKTKIKNVPAGQGLFLYEGAAAMNIKKALEGFNKGLSKNLSQPLEKLTLFIGAEGGFSVEEVKTFTDAGFLPVTLGALVLRVETACIAILSVIQYHFDNMS